MSTFTYFGQPKPRINAGTGNITVSGLAGASFSSLYVQPSRVLNNTFIAFSRSLTSGGTGEISSVNVGTNVVSPLYFSVEGVGQPTASSNSIVFNQLIGLDMFKIRPDGSLPTALSASGPIYHNYPAFSPNGANIAVDGGGAELWYFPAAGGKATLVQSNDAGAGVAWTSNGSDLMYIAENTSGYNNLYMTALTGGTTSNYTPLALVNSGNFRNPTCNADGLTFAADYTPSGSSTSKIILGALNTSTYQTLTPSGYNDSLPCFSPDGTKIAFYRSNAGGAYPGIYTSDEAGTNQTLLVADPPSGSDNTGPVTGISWSNFPPNTQYIGSGAYPFVASGFLLSQNGSQFGSLVAFTESTPANAVITSSPSSGAYQPLIFTISGSTITRIGWTTDFWNFGTYQVPPAGTTSALVTIDAQTGQVDIVADALTLKPAVANRSAGGNQTYVGKFTAIFDGTGKNLAPSGASQVVVNPKTGRLVSFQ